MPIQEETIEQVNLATSKYKYGFSTDLEVDKAPKGLNENIIRLISSKKDEPEWMLDWRLKAFEIWNNCQILYIYILLPSHQFLIMTGRSL